MATKRKSSTSSAKSSAKTQYKRAAVKKPNKSTKAVAAKTAKKSSPKSWLKSTRNWNLALAIILALQAVLIYVFGKASTVPIVSNYITKDTLASQATGQNVQAPAIRQLFNIDLRYFIVAYLLVSAVIFILMATLRRQQYEDGLQKQTNNFRWLNMGISGGMLLMLVALVNGVYDGTILLVILILALLLNMLSMFSESKLSDWKLKRQVFTAICVVGATIWLIILLTLKSDILYGSGLNQIVYWIDGILFAIAIGLAYSRYHLLKGDGKWADYLYGDRVFLLLTFAAQTILAWLVFVGYLS